jgi:hypothetical protein
VSKRLTAPYRSGPSRDWPRSGCTPSAARTTLSETGLLYRDSEAEAMQVKVLTKDEARRIAVNVARFLLNRERDT